MKLRILSRRALAHAAALLCRLSHPKHGHAVLIAILAAYSAVWTLYAVIAKSTQGIHPDMAEIAAWAQDLEWGTPKHPPLLPALVRAWFSVFPAVDWAFYLLAVVSVAVAIYVTWQLSSMWLRGARLAAVPFMLMLIPFYNFLALRLDHNVILIPLWAITTYAFTKSFVTRSISWSIAAGAFAACALLAKYWSIFLLLGLGVAALIDPRRLEYLKSPAPWIVAAVSLAVLAPHFMWLDANAYSSITYTRNRMMESWTDVMRVQLGYVFGTLGYIVMPLAMLALLSTPSKAALKDIFNPQDRERRLALVMFSMPLLAAIPITILTKTRLSALWSMSGLSLLAVVLLSSPHIRFTRKSAAVFASAAIVVSIGALLAAPFVAIVKLTGGIENHAAYTRLLAAEVRNHWDRETGQPLRLVQSTYLLANPVAFHIADKPLPIPFDAPTLPRWEAPETIDRWGAAIVCPAASPSCLAMMESARAGRPAGERIEVSIQPRWLGFTGERRDFVMDVLRPREDGWVADQLCCVSATKRLNPAP